jgi:tRNA pseudouridine synthase 10
MTDLLDIVSALSERGLCDHCLGRQLGKLHSGTTNDERGRSLRLMARMAKMFDEHTDASSENNVGGEGPEKEGNGGEIGQNEMKGKSSDAGLIQDIEEKESDPVVPEAETNPSDIPIEPDPNDGSCDLCGGLFLETETFADLITESFSEFSFETYLVGSVIDDEIIETEKELQEELGISEYAESIKGEMNRVVGLKVYDRIRKEVSFEKPDIVGVVDTRFDIVSLQISPLFLYGRYQKFDRTIPQTVWNCKRCRGRGCEYCNGTGKIYPTSVQEQIGDIIIREIGGSRHLFHGMGREDIDARMIGTGRPFILEISNPKLRKPDLEKLTGMVNEEAKEMVSISGLRMARREHVAMIKNMASDKSYEAQVEFETDIIEERLREMEEFFTGTVIFQRTPTRVAHRRSDLVRERKVINMDCKLLDGRHATFMIKGESGLYIKELIHGNEGRTQPSVSEFLDTGCKVTALDVVDVHYDDNLN